MLGNFSFFDFLSIFKIIFYFFRDISFLKNSQLNSTGLCPNTNARLGVARLYMRPAVPHDTFFKMADNTVRHEDPINPIEEAKSLRENLATPEKAKIARERKIQTNTAGKNCNKTTFKRRQVKKKQLFINYSASLKIKWKLLDTFIANFNFWEFISNLWLGLLPVIRANTWSWGRVT